MRFGHELLTWNRGPEALADGGAAGRANEACGQRMTRHAAAIDAANTATRDVQDHRRGVRDSTG